MSCPTVEDGGGADLDACVISGRLCCYQTSTPGLLRCVTLSYADGGAL
jgi:hypothetical protein